MTMNFFRVGVSVCCVHSISWHYSVNTWVRLEVCANVANSNSHVVVAIQECRVIPGTTSRLCPRTTLCYKNYDRCGQTEPRCVVYSWEEVSHLSVLLPLNGVMVSWPSTANHDLTMMINITPTAFADAAAATIVTTALTISSSPLWFRQRYRCRFCCSSTSTTTTAIGPLDARVDFFPWFP